MAACCRWAISNASIQPRAHQSGGRRRGVVLKLPPQPHADRANDVSVVLDLMIHDLDLVLELAQAQVVAWRRPACG